MTAGAVIRFSLHEYEVAQTLAYSEVQTSSLMNTEKYLDKLQSQQFCIQDARTRLLSWQQNTHCIFGFYGVDGSLADARHSIFETRIKLNSNSYSRVSSIP